MKGMTEKERTEIVIDETTIYEIDLECAECRKIKKNEPERAKEKRCRG